MGGPESMIGQTREVTGQSALRDRGLSRRWMAGATPSDCRTPHWCKTVGPAQRVDVLRFASVVTRLFSALPQNTFEVVSWSADIGQPDTPSSCSRQGCVSTEGRGLVNQWLGNLSETTLLFSSVPEGWEELDTRFLSLAKCNAPIGSLTYEWN